MIKNFREIEDDHICLLIFVYGDKKTNFGDILGVYFLILSDMYVVCTHYNRTIESILMCKFNHTNIFIEDRKRQP